MRRTIKTVKKPLKTIQTKKTFNIVCPSEVKDGYLLTKSTRKDFFGGGVSGGANSRKPEEFQRKMIEEGTGITFPKTKMRINIRTHELKEIARPNMKVDGFDYSEDFDGVQNFNDKTVYINLKCICDSGGSQTRSLREVYWFVESQLNHLKFRDTTNTIYFANILDGDECHKNFPKFEYLLSHFDEDIKSNIYVGDLKGYFSWILTKV